MDKRTYHHGDLRAALVEAGLTLLAARKADDLSLREVARTVGVSATAVYRHFPDKGALMTALAHEGLDRLAAAQHVASDAAGGGPAGFAATGRAYVRFALANPALFRLISASPVPQARGANSDAYAFPQANAAAAAADQPTDEAADQPTDEAADQPTDDAARIVAVQAWALVHGLAMLMLDGQIPQEEALIDRAIVPR